MKMWYVVVWYDDKQCKQRRIAGKETEIFDYLCEYGAAGNYIIGKIGIWCGTVSDWDYGVWRQFIFEQIGDKYDIQQIIIKIRKFVNLYNMKYHFPSFDPYIYHKYRLIIDCYIQSCLRDKFDVDVVIDLNVIQMIFNYYVYDESISSEFYTNKMCKILNDGPVISVNKKMLDKFSNNEYICCCVQKVPWNVLSRFPDKIRIKCKKYLYLQKQ